MASPSLIQVVEIWQLNQLPIDPEERQIVSFLDDMLCTMSDCARQFKHAIKLFDHAAFLYQSTVSHSRVGAFSMTPEQQMFFAWQLIAAHDGAIVLYNFAEASEAIAASLNQVKNIPTNSRLFRTARKDFLKYFPDLKGIRHSVA